MSDPQADAAAVTPEALKTLQEQVQALTDRLNGQIACDEGEDDNPQESEEEPQSQDNDHLEDDIDFFDPFEALTSLPSRFGLRDEARWLYTLERDLVAGRLS
ncbi:hypothetical protein J8273_8542 [Carpediemonas membranifera]|uniref:Uncharacterized protein n=1 Tax=Carpediemonas membranifera TaxID=201153 RepID=A0A8J6APS4_9EUKA|nr:hypothetical protein J8273_8542 [Carpediemonas membranifera]|eukprot:KAG9389863.1 hypothetical protein J8273_8542 [Carpediemonas membranifera]